MYPTVCIGPPNPWMKPAAQGTRHCQRYRPLGGVLNVKEIVSWSFFSVQGAFEQGFLALSEIPLSGTYRPMAGIANTCEASLGVDRLDALAVQLHHTAG